MLVFGVGFCAASMGATLGLVLGSLFAGGKRRDLESAYEELSRGVRDFIRSHPLGTGIIPTAQDELLALKRVLHEADEVVRR